MVAFVNQFAKKSRKDVSLVYEIRREVDELGRSATEKLTNATKMQPDAKHLRRQSAWSKVASFGVATTAISWAEHLA